MNGGEFRAYVVTKRGFPAQNSSDNGERARSLLCGREALARPSGMAENTQRGSDLTSGKFRRVEIYQGVGRSLTRRLWRAGGTPKTHLVPPFCGTGAAAVATKHFLSGPGPGLATADGL